MFKCPSQRIPISVWDLGVRRPKQTEPHPTLYAPNTQSNRTRIQSDPSRCIPKIASVYGVFNPYQNNIVEEALHMQQVRECSGADPIVVSFDVMLVEHGCTSCYVWARHSKHRSLRRGATGRMWFLLVRSDCGSVLVRVWVSLDVDVRGVFELAVCCVV